MPVLENLLGLAEDALDAISGETAPRPSPGRSAATQAACDRVSSRAARAGRSSRTTDEAGQAIQVARKTEFRVLESVDAETGVAVFLLKNDAGDRAECNSYELAERIRRALG